MSNHTNRLKTRLQGAMDSVKSATEKVAISGTKEKLKDVFTKNEEHIIVQLAGSNMKVLLPDGYVRIKYKNPLKEMERSIIHSETFYQKTVSTSDDIVMICKIDAKDAMNPADVQGLIDGIHQNLSDSQGMIEVKSGKTNRGYTYIYSIIKDLSSKRALGVKYYLRLNLFHGQDIVEIQANFSEINTTGQREAMSHVLAKKAGLMEIEEDPYDPTFKKGKLKNLAEKEGLDGLFPENPLTQCHELLLAVLQDAFVISLSEKERQSMVADDHVANLFVDTCQRKTYTVKIEDNKDIEKKEKEDLSAISTRNALKIIYYLMAVDGQSIQTEEEKFDSIGQELDPNFGDIKDEIVSECQKQVAKAIDSEDYYDTLQDGVAEALMISEQVGNTIITPKLFIWDLLTIAYSDGNYNKVERKLIKYIVRKTNIDKAIFLEMESSLLTIMDIEKELTWIKKTDKPYLTIEAMVNELDHRKNVIFDIIKDLIAL